MHRFLLVPLLIACVSEVSAQPVPAPPAQPSRTLASLLSEGYEMQETRLFKDKIWMRKPGDGGVVTFICDRGRIGSPAFDSYRNGNYDEISCTPAP